MSNRDETDLVRNDNDLVSKTEQSTKINDELKHEQINGNNDAENDNNLDQQINSANSSSEKTTHSVAESNVIPSEKSNWVQFENDDKNDKVIHKTIDVLKIKYLLMSCIYQ